MCQDCQDAITQSKQRVALLAIEIKHLESQVNYHAGRYSVTGSTNEFLRYQNARTSLNKAKEDLELDRDGYQPLNGIFTIARSKLAWYAPDFLSGHACI